MLDNKQNEISAEDQEVMAEMQMLLGEFEIHTHEGGETPQKSSFELLKQCAGVLEKNVERLAQRAEDRKSTRLNSSHSGESRMPSSA